MSVPVFREAARWAVILFAADRATKSFFAGLPFPEWTTGRVISLVQHRNEGVIANIPVPQAIIITLTIVVLFLVAGALWTAAKEGHIAEGRALGILLGGAVGNLFDRIAQGYVFDWILLFGTSAINIADIAIVVGGLSYFLLKRKQEQMEEGRGVGSGE